MHQLTDATGYRLWQDRPFARVVSLVPSLTELLLDLGVTVVGRTRFCIHPAEAVTGIPVVGGTKDFDLAKIRALQPDLILANREENVAEPLLSLRTQIPVWTTQVRDLPEALSMIATVGQLTGQSAQAQSLIQRIEAAFARLPSRPLGRVVYLIWRRPWMSVGSDTFIHDMIQRCGWINLTAEQPRYPCLTDAQLKELNPDTLLLASEPYPFGPGHLPELQDLCPQACLQQVDGSFFSWYGSRLLEAANYFQQLTGANG